MSVRIDQPRDYDMTFATNFLPATELTVVIAASTDNQAIGNG
jgi:hypothetical protein